LKLKLGFLDVYLRGIFPEKIELLPPCAKRESLGFYAFKCISLRVFVVNHNCSLQLKPIGVPVKEIK
jgi:hypothetical protein